jgi:hypothetical protein
VLKASRAFIAVLVLATAAFAVPASAQAASITVDQACIESTTPEPGGGLVSGSFSGAPTSGYDPQSFVSAEDSEPQGPSNFWVHYGGQSVRIDAEGNGTFSFNLAADYGSQLPDTLWVTLRLTNGQWTPFATVEVPVCGRAPDPDPDTDGDGVVDSVDNCDNDVNPGQENNDVDAEGDACDADDDNDGVNDGGDNCQFTANPLQGDDDGDGTGNACDGTFDSSDGKSSGGGWLATPDGKVNFSSSAKSVDGVMAGNCIVTVGETKIKCLTVDGYFQSATNDRAVFVGNATQDGVATRYRIELTDNGEPGTADHIEITTDAGFSAAGVLGSGNLQVHVGI